MKRKRKRLNIEVYKEDGTECWKIGAVTIYQQIYDAVMDSVYRPATDRPIFPYPYEDVMNFVAHNYGLTRKDLERAFSKCRKVYDAAVTDLYEESYHQAWWALRENKTAKKALNCIVKEASTYRRIMLRDEGE